MDYQEAKERLDKPVCKNSKKIGHKLTLRRHDWAPPGGEVDKRPIYLKYFATDILTFLPDGGVEIDDGGFMHSRCTREKINKHLPYGWQLSLQATRYSKHARVGLLYRRDRFWEMQDVIPYVRNVPIYASGRRDIEGVEKHSASELTRQAAAFCGTAVNTFLRGELPFGGSEEQEILDELTLTYKATSARGDKSKISAMALDFLSQKLPPGPLFRFLQEENLGYLGLSYDKRALMRWYWKEVYAHTREPKTLEQKIKQLKAIMREGELGLRPAGNSSTFHDLKKSLLSQVESFLLESLGFSVIQV